MNDINGAGANNAAKSQPNEHSRRPGTSGHPGKHLGQMKRAEGMNPSSANLPLFQQQIAAMNSDGVGGAGSAKGQQAAQQNEIANQELALDALRSTSDAISDQMRFTSRFNAIGTAFF